MKVSPAAGPANTIVMNTQANKKLQKGKYQWWTETDKRKLKDALLATAVDLKVSQNYRFRQAAIYARLYGNISLFNFMGPNMSKMDMSSGLPQDRPTFNVIQSAIDTLTSRIGQNRPSPVFLTDAGDYKERSLAKKLNNFIQGEFYQTKAYEKSVDILKDALVEGMGCMLVYETDDHKVGLERVLCTELLVDLNEAMYGAPRRLYRTKLIDREVLKGWFSKKKDIVNEAEQAYPDDGADSSKTVSDLVLVVEGWSLPSVTGAKDGRHTIACSSGILLDEEYTKDRFPVAFLPYSKRLLGFWPQGVAEQLMGTQMEINSILSTISKSIKLVGVPRVFVEKGSKIVKAHLNNDVGAIVEYSGTPPQYVTAECVPQELYAQLQRLIDYAYQQCGVSALQATSQKPAGLNSGEAIRSYDDISTDRFATFSKRYDDYFIELAYLMMDKAVDIAKEQGEYMTVYPNKDGTKEIDLPKLDIEEKPFVIQCFNMSSLPKEPAGRLQKITEMIQAGMISIKEGRRLLDFPDLGQVERLANAGEERIYFYLDKIVEEGEYNAPDPFLDLALAEQIVTDYINLYIPAKLEPEKADMLRDFFQQIQDIKQAAMTPPQPAAPAATPQARPEQLPTSPLVPNAPQGAPVA